MKLSYNQLETLAERYYGIFNNKYMYEEEFKRLEDLTNYGTNPLSKYTLQLIIQLSESHINLTDFEEKITIELNNSYIGQKKIDDILDWSKHIYEYLQHSYAKEQIKSIREATIIT